MTFSNFNAKLKPLWELIQSRIRLPLWKSHPIHLLCKSIGWFLHTKAINRFNERSLPDDKNTVTDEVKQIKLFGNFGKKIHLLIRIP